MTDFIRTPETGNAVPLPDFIREDWPEAEFGIDATRGITVRALGLSRSYCLSCKRVWWLRA